MKRLAKDLVREAEQLGYVHDRTNTHGYLVYLHPSGHEVQICPSAAEHQARAVSKAMRKATGSWEQAAGRNATAVKERTAKRRQLEGERLAADRRRVQAEHDAYLARIDGAPHLKSDPAALRQVESYLRELDRLDLLMRAIPSGGDHSGSRHARHTAGARP